MALQSSPWLRRQTHQLFVIMSVLQGVMEVVGGRGGIFMKHLD